MTSAYLFSIILQTKQYVSPEQVGGVISFIFLIIVLLIILAILHVFIRWVIGTSVIIKNQDKIIQLLTQFAKQKGNDSNV